MSNFTPIPFGQFVPILHDAHIKALMNKVMEPDERGGLRVGAILDAAEFVRAVRERHPMWLALGGQPDLVEALDHCTAERFLGFDLRQVPSEQLAYLND